MRKTKKCATDAKKVQKMSQHDLTWRPKTKKMLFPTGWRTPTLYSVRSVIPVLLYENPFK